MPDLAVYNPADLPPVFAWQIRSFIRTVWPFLSREDPDDPMTALAWHPTHFVLHEAEMVLGHAAVVWKQLEHDGVAYRTYGLSGVFTFPAQRGKGYGAQLADAATTLIDNRNPDMAMLFTGTDVIDFYTKLGWVHVPDITILTGDKDHPEDARAVTMMRFGTVDPARFAKARVYFGPLTW